MIFEDGNYYLLCYRADPEYVNKVKAFRLDRIEDPEIVSEPISQNAVEVLKMLAHIVYSLSRCMAAVYER